MAHVRVTIQTGKYPDSRFDFDKAFTLDELLIRDTFAPIDLPLPDADCFSKMLCTSEATAKVVKKLRKDYAKTLTKIMLMAFEEAMGKNDLLMGYKPEEVDRAYDLGDALSR